MKKLWITSVLVCSTRMFLPTGTTSSLSTVEQPQLAGLQLVVRDDVAGEVDVVLVGVGVFPVPLMPGHLDRQVGVARAVLVIDQAERRDRDHHQDQHRDHRPGDLEHGVVRGAARHRIALGVVAPHHPDQQPGDEQRDQRDDDQHQVVQRDLVAAFSGPKAGCMPISQGRGAPTAWASADATGQQPASSAMRRAAAGIATSADPSRFGPPIRTRPGPALAPAWPTGPRASRSRRTVAGTDIAATAASRRTSVRAAAPA